MAAEQWWVIVGTLEGAAPTYTYFQGTQAEAQQRAKLTIEVATQKNLYGPYESKAAAQSAVASGSVKAPSNSPSISTSWLTGLGGMIGSGLEAGAAAFVDDLWTAIIGYVEIIAGALVALFVLIFIFRNQMGQLPMVIPI